MQAALIIRGGLVEQIHTFPTFAEAVAWVAANEDIVASGPWYEGSGEPAELGTLNEDYAGYYRVGRGDLEVTIRDVDEVHDTDDAERAQDRYAAARLIAEYRALFGSIRTPASIRLGVDGDGCDSWPTPNGIDNDEGVDLLALDLEHRIH